MTGSQMERDNLGEKNSVCQGTERRVIAASEHPELTGGWNMTCPIQQELHMSAGGTDGWRDGPT